MQSRSKKTAWRSARGEYACRVGVSTHSRSVESAHRHDIPFFGKKRNGNPVSEPRVRCAPAAVTRPKVSPTLARSICCSCWPHDRETLSGKALSAAPGVVSRCGLWSIESDIRQACRRMAAGDVALPGIGQWMPADYGQLNFKPLQNLNSSDQANRGRANQSRQRASAQIIYWRASSQENFPHPTHNTDCCCCLSLAACSLLCSTQSTATTGS